MIVGGLGLYTCVFSSIGVLEIKGPADGDKSRYLVDLETYFGDI